MAQKIVSAIHRREILESAVPSELLDAIKVPVGSIPGKVGVQTSVLIKNVTSHQMVGFAK